MCRRKGVREGIKYNRMPKDNLFHRKGGEKHHLHLIMQVNGTIMTINYKLQSVWNQELGITTVIVIILRFRQLRKNQNESSPT